MKTLKRLLLLLPVAFCTSWSIGMAQTVQLYPTATVTNGLAWCLNREVSGFITYHLTYHLNKKTGYADRVHANVHKAELWDSKTGEKYKVIDTGGTDNLGVSWGFWSDPDNPGFDYDLEPNSIPFGTLPTEGCNIWATFKWIAPGGEKYTMRGVTVVHINANGETTAEFNKVYEDCNY